MKKIKVFMVQNGKIKLTRVYDLNSILATRIQRDPERWIAWAKGKPLLWGRRYTYLICPEVAWTLGHGDIVTILNHGKPPDYYGAVRLLTKEQVEAMNLGKNILPNNPKGNPEGNPTEINTEDPTPNAEGDTFNPSTLWNDKTMSEWFGNLVQGAEEKAMKGIVTSGQKISKGLVLLVLLCGGLIGFMMGVILASL